MVIMCYVLYVYCFWLGKHGFVNFLCTGTVILVDYTGVRFIIYMYTVIPVLHVLLLSLSLSIQLVHIKGI